MHRAFAAWLVANPWRAIVATAVCGVLSPQGISPIAVVAGAIPVLLLVAGDPRSGWRTGLHAAVAGGVAVGGFLIAIGEPVWLSLAAVALLFFAPFVLAWVAQATGSLRLCFQSAVLGAGVLLATIYWGLEDPVQQWRELLNAAVKQVAESGLVKDEEALLVSLAATNWGTYIALWLVTVLGSLFLGCWWQSLVQAPQAFGKEFQQLHLGKVLGAVALLIIVAAVAFDRLSIEMPLIAAALWIAVVALAVQGLAAMHRMKASGSVGRGWLTATYVLLIVPLTMLIMVMLLAGWGLADNWRRA